MKTQRYFFITLILIGLSFFSNGQGRFGLEVDSLNNSYPLGKLDSFQIKVFNKSTQDTIYRDFHVTFYNTNTGASGVFSDTVTKIVPPQDTVRPDAIFRATGNLANVGINTFRFKGELLSGFVPSDTIRKSVNITDTVNNPLKVDLNPDDSLSTMLEDTFRMGDVDSFKVGLINKGNGVLDTLLKVNYKAADSLMTGEIVDSINLNLPVGDTLTTKGSFIANSAYVPGGPSGVAIWPEFIDPGTPAGDTVLHNIYVMDTTSAIPETPNNFKTEIYPNPAKQTIHIETGDQKNISHVSITTLQGSLVQYHEDFATKIPIRGLSPGTYLMTITFRDQKKIHKKIIKRP